MAEPIQLHNDTVIIRRGELEAILQGLADVQAIGARAAALLCDRLDLDDCATNPEEPLFFTANSDGLPGDSGDHEHGGDDEGGAYVEWHTMRGSQKGGPNILAGHEDDEEDDDAGQCSEDEISCGSPFFGRKGAGCELSDPDAEHDGREPEDEI